MRSEAGPATTRRRQGIRIGDDGKRGRTSVGERKARIKDLGWQEARQNQQQRDDDKELSGLTMRAWGLFVSNVESTAILEKRARKAIGSGYNSKKNSRVGYGSAFRYNDNSETSYKNEGGYGNVGAQGMSKAGKDVGGARQGNNLNINRGSRFKVLDMDMEEELESNHRDLCVKIRGSIAISDITNFNRSNGKKSSDGGYKIKAKGSGSSKESKGEEQAARVHR
ncbi:hypothetical protein ACOSQ4_031242 [Xanthoceras sorbifolium]